MRTKYIGIESIVILYYDQITIACTVMFEGMNYDEPIYTNIFCDYYELKRFLNFDLSEFGSKMTAEITSKFLEKNGENIQIDLPDYLETKKPDWKFPVSVNLKSSSNSDIPFQCYQFDKLFN